MFYQINVIGKFTPILNRVYFFLAFYLRVTN